MHMQGRAPKRAQFQACHVFSSNTRRLVCCYAVCLPSACDLPRYFRLMFTLCVSFKKIVQVSSCWANKRQRILFTSSENTGTASKLRPKPKLKPELYRLRSDCIYDQTQYIWNYFLESETFGILWQLAISSWSLKCIPALCCWIYTWMVRCTYVWKCILFFFFHFSHLIYVVFFGLLPVEKCTNLCSLLAESTLWWLKATDIPHWISETLSVYAWISNNWRKLLKNCHFTDVFSSEKLSSAQIDVLK